MPAAAAYDPRSAPLVGTHRIDSAQPAHRSPMLWEFRAYLTAWIAVRGASPRWRPAGPVTGVSRVRTALAGDVQHGPSDHDRDSCRAGQLGRRRPRETTYPQAEACRTEPPTASWLLGAFGHDVPYRDPGSTTFTAAPIKSNDANTGSCTSSPAVPHTRAATQTARKARPLNEEPTLHH